MGAAPPVETTLVAALMGLIILTIFFGSRSAEERRFLLPLGIGAYVLRVAAVPVYYHALMDAGLEGFAFLDAYEYHLDGIEILGEFTRGLDYKSRGWNIVDPGYSIFTGMIYWLMGPNTLVMRIVNCMFASFTLLYIYRIARLVIDDVRAARYACYLVAFLPFSTLIYINHRKEPIVAMLATFIFLHALRVMRFEKTWQFSVIGVVAGLFFMFFFRSGFVLPFLAILLFCYFVTTQSLVRAVLLAVPTVVLVVSIQYLISGDVPFSVEASSARFQGKAADSAALSQTGGMVRFARMTSPLDLWKLPLATFLAVILPYPPVFVGSLPSILLSWLNLFNLAFLPAMIQGAMSTLRRETWRKQLPLLLFPGVFLILIGAVHVGITRYRETVFPMLLLLAGLGLSRRINIPIYAATYGGLLMLGVVVYFFR